MDQTAGPEVTANSLARVHGAGSTAIDEHFGASLRHLPVTVLVDGVLAHLCSPGVDGGIAIVAVAGLRRLVISIWSAEALGDIGSPTIAIGIDIEEGAIAGAIVGLAIAVIVNPITDFGCPRVDRGVERFTIDTIGVTWPQLQSTRKATPWRSRQLATRLSAGRAKRR